MKPSRSTSNLTRLPAILATLLLTLQLVLVPTRSVAAQGIDPRYLAVSDDEAGKQATRTINEDGSVA